MGAGEGGGGAGCAGCAAGAGGGGGGGAAPAGGELPSGARRRCIAAFGSNAYRLMRVDVNLNLSFQR